MAVAVDGLGKSFGSTVAVRDVTFHAERGAVLGLLGPNGAGKTTTVRMLATLTVPDHGLARIDGFDVVRDPNAVRRVISLTGQYTSVDQHLTGRENLRLVMRLHHVTATAGRRRADELLAQFQLEHAADRPVRTYSGGMRRRLDLAASVASRPSVLFLDEPTTGLDPTSRIGMWAAVRDLVGEGTTVILTTQYLEEADQLCDDLVVVDHGTVVARGTPDELKSVVGGDAIEILVARGQSVRRALAVVERATRAIARVDEAAGRIVVPVGDDAAPLLAVLVHQMADAGVVMSGIGLRRPSLDEVFMALTGHHAGDDSSGPAGPGSSGVVVSAATGVAHHVGPGHLTDPEGPTRTAGTSVVADALADAGFAAAGFADAGFAAAGFADAGFAGAGFGGAGFAGAGQAGIPPRPVRPGIAPAGTGSPISGAAPVDPATEGAAPLPGASIAIGARLWGAVTDWRAVAWRNIVRFLRQPLAVVSVVLQPLMYVAMFRYVFGGALSLAIPGGHFVSFLLPGIVAQTMAFSSMSTALGLAEDIGTGMVDRLRSLPVARSAVIIGRLLADAVQAVVVIVVILAVGMAVGFRFANGVGPAIGMVLVALAFGLVSSAGTAFLGIRTRSPEVAMSVGLTTLFPVCFVSAAFVPIATLPGWLQPVARANPVTVVVEAMRALALGGPAAVRVVEAVAWMLGIAAFFVPMAVRSYRRTV